MCRTPGFCRSACCWARARWDCWRGLPCRRWGSSPLPGWLYFAGAFGAHMRVRDFQLGPWSVYFLLAVAALVTNLAHHR